MAEIINNLSLPKHQTAPELNNMDSSIAQRYFGWPDWNEKLGKAPIILVSYNADKTYLNQLNEILTRISGLTHIESATALRAQLKALGSMPINIEPSLGLPQTEANAMQHAPILKFDPNAWGRYPIEGAMVLPKSHAEKRDAPLKYSNTNYAISAPEQLLINALGHYEMHYKAYQYSQLITNTGDLNYTNQVGKFSALATTPAHIVKRYENPSMLSVFSDFKLRDSARTQEQEWLPAGNDGLPKVHESEKNALDFALKVRGDNAKTVESMMPLSQLGQSPLQTLTLAAREIQLHVSDDGARNIAFKQLAEIAQNKGINIIDVTKKLSTDNEVQA